MEQQIKDTPKNKSNISKTSKSIFHFYPDRCIALGDYLDILLNRVNASGRRNLPAFEDINYSLEPKSKLVPLSSYTPNVSANKRTSTNQMKNGNSKQPENEEKFLFEGGILLPRPLDSEREGKEAGDEGSGNIVIMGAAGTGKSTLAFQMAAACASKLNHGIAVYYSLEVSFQQFRHSMIQENQKELDAIMLTPMYDSSEQLNLDSDQALGNALRSSLNTDSTGRMNEETGESKILPQILFPNLSPCSISDDQVNHDEVFLKRFKELELLLRAIYAYNRGVSIQFEEKVEKANQQSKAERKQVMIAYDAIDPRIKMVVIDSINAFSNNALNRQEIIRLMSLFKEYGIIGIFTLGDDGNAISPEKIQGSTIQYLADVVISLKSDYTNSYTHNYLEITKSRYRQQVIGKHPYKISQVDSSVMNLARLFTPGIKKKLEVLPSLHYRTNASTQFDENRTINEVKGEWNLFGITLMSEILPEHFRTRPKELAQIITIIGESGLYKSDIAINALLEGNRMGENGLIVRLSDRELFRYSGVRLSKQLFGKIEKKANHRVIQMEETLMDQESKKASKLKLYKFDIHGWKTDFSKDNARLYEVTFKSGVLYPEEMVDELLRIIRLHNVKRIVLADLKLIGVSYPFLVDSPTSGKIFLSAFLHIMRNYGIHVIITSSLSAQAASVDQINNARVLSDAVLDIKQSQEPRNVTIFGEGLITKGGEPYYIIPEKKRTEFRYGSNLPAAEIKIRKGKVKKEVGLEVFEITDKAPRTLKSKKSKTTPLKSSSANTSLL